MPDHTQIPCWVNGVPADGVSIADRGLAYGDGVFETVRVTRDGPVLLPYHLQRLRDGLQRLNIAVEWAALEQEIHRYPGWQQPGVVKLIITRGNGGRGYGTVNVQGPSRVFSTHPIPQYPEQHRQKGVCIYSCETRLSINPQLAGIKHLNRLEQVLARQEFQSDSCQDQYQEGLMLSQSGRVIEGVFSNLFLVRDGVVLTPDLSQCGVAGVMRRWLLEQMQESGIKVNVGRVTLQDIELADEWFFCNSVYGVWPVGHWENRVWPVGPLTARAQQWVTDRWQF